MSENNRSALEALNRCRTHLRFAHIEAQMAAQHLYGARAVRAYEPHQHARRRPPPAPGDRQAKTPTRHDPAATSLPGAAHPHHQKESSQQPNLTALALASTIVKTGTAEQSRHAWAFNSADQP